MWMDAGAEGTPSKLHLRVFSSLLFCTGDMVQWDKHTEDKPLVLQLAAWSLRGVARVILANNPVSGAVILAALCWASPWQCMLGTLGVLASTGTAVLIGQDSAEVSAGLHGFNGKTHPDRSYLLYSGLSSVLDRWDLPVSVFPFNIVILLYLLCTGPGNPYYPHHSTTPPGALLEANATQLSVPQLVSGIPLGVGQIYACGALGPSLLILGAVLLYSPLLAIHALLGSAAGTLAGLSVAVHHGSLYSGLSGFNGALGCMAVGGVFFTFSWRTHLFAVTSAFLSAYADIALSNLLGTVGLPACSWAATLTVTLMLLLTGQSLAAYRIPIGHVRAPEHNLHSRSKWRAGDSSDIDV
ncbi:urea transporter 1 [Diretmus argenteus]